LVFAKYRMYGQMYVTTAVMVIYSKIEKKIFFWYLHSTYRTV
jgi:hypothetical protein